MNIPLIEISEQDNIALTKVLHRLTHFNLDTQSCDINPSLLEQFKKEIFSANFYPGLSLKAKYFLHPDSKGYVIIDFSKANIIGDDLQKVLTVILSGIMTPFGIFKKLGLWREVGVDLNKEPNRSSGIGYNPFHIDFVNTTIPPYYSILYCVREDPRGGGQTIVSNFLKTIQELSSNEIESLQECVFEEGAFFELNNVGSELNPFPVIQNNLGEMVIRFTSKIKSRLNQDFFIKKIEGLLIKNQEVLLLKKNQLVVFNQRAVCHGRLALGDNQERINVSDRRLLIQTFGKV